METKGTPADFHTVTVKGKSNFDKEVNKWLAKGYCPVGGVNLIEARDTHYDGSDDELTPCRTLTFTIGMLKPPEKPKFDQ